MRRPILLWITLAIASLPLFATADTQSPVTLWVVHGETNQVYLLGSVHLLRESDHPLPRVFDQAYEDAESIIMEIDMDDLDPLASQGAVNRLGVLPPGQTLAAMLGPRDYATAEKAAAKIDIPLEMLAQSEPWLAAMTIQELILTRLGFNPLFGVELAMVSKAQQDRKSIEGLETFEQQIGFLDGLSPATQKRWLLETLDAGSEAGSLMEEMVAAWKSGDVDSLEASMLSEFESAPELYDVIVRDRNNRWLAQLEPLFDDEDDYLIVVGALHLVGSDGLPARFADAGREVEQLASDSVLEAD